MKKTKMTEEQTSHINMVRDNLKKGDLITHTRCMGAVEEHIFTGYDGHWACGKSTKMTKKYSANALNFTNDISPLNITHINRDLVNNLDDMENFYNKKETK